MLDLPHHDGSGLHVGTISPALGGAVDVFLRVPHTYGARAVHVRAMCDGEPAWSTATPAREDRHDVWWRARVQVANPVTPYRFLVDRGDRGCGWVNGTGTHERDVTDAADFRLTVSQPPGWVRDAVLYQVFCDRFARSDRAPAGAPAWAVPAAWDEPVVERGPHTPLQFYGGDLWGVAQRLDHVEKLGADVVYLTPFFPAASNHRYNAATFDRVDPLLGGDEALVHLVEQAHHRGLRVLGDLTTNHCGATHEWFVRACADPASEEAGYFLFDEHPGRYACWLGEPTLPKLDYASAALRARMLEGPDSVVARGLRPPFDLDGWRIDVANMTARHGAEDRNHEVARLIRGAVKGADPDAYLLAEHFHDASADLAAGGWDGVMNYAGFLRPVWSWLRDGGADGDLATLGMPVPLPKVGGDAAVAAMREVLAAAPWAAMAASAILLGSHDTPRVRTVLGADALVEVAVGLLATYVGVPMVFAGDEVGMEGTDGEDARRPMPWDDPARMAHPLAEVYRDLLALRRAHPALRHGGLRWAHASRDAVAYLRETAGERLLVLATRDRAAVTLPATAVGDHLRLLYGAAAADVSGDDVRLAAGGPSFTVWDA